MAGQEAYMLRRNAEESRRLDQQHAFMRELAHGSLVQPSIPTSNLGAVADVGTGTGIWLRQAARELRSTVSPVTSAKDVTPSKDLEFVGFDISAEQFAESESPGVRYVVHDIVRPFAQQYHGKFDLVHVRLLSYALKAQELDIAVRNVIQIIRPGGHLQWQEFDAIDSWSDPDSANARSTVKFLVEERVSRGLAPAIFSPLVKAIMSPTVPIPDGKVSSLNWTGDLMRIMHVDTISTRDHPSQMVIAGKKLVVMGAAIQLLQAGVLRREEILKQDDLDTDQSDQLTVEIKDLKKLVEAWSHGQDPACNEWDCAMTSIVAQKAAISGKHEKWMAPKF